MPLDEFKTQVLLLHSDQRTLDSFGSQFSDRYTVHYATSGSQALHALAEVPINVIVSAHDLPGMSGLETLREAKKRSPDTFGILLAGSEGDEVEALVGDEEVFQVVHGSVDERLLLELVESATGEVRLAALSESANDTAAKADDVPDHIVMETADNGASIISQSSARLRALNPKSYAAAAPVDVVVLTTDDEFLETIRSSTGSRHKVHVARTLAEADDIIRNHQVGVAVVDAAIVRNKIEQLTQYLRREASRLVPVVAGRRDDGEMLMGLIDRGKVYRFLLKPVSPGRARLAVEAAVKHHIEAPDAAFSIGADDPEDAADESQPAAKSDIDHAEPTTQQTATFETSGPTESTAGPESASVMPEPPANAGSVEVELLKKTGAHRLATMVDAAGAAPGGQRDIRKWLGIAAAATIVVLGALLWFGLGPDSDSPVSGVPAPTPTTTGAAVDTTTPVIDDAVEQALRLAESALIESRLQVAAAALQQVADADPDNVRLPFLTAQLKQAQLRINLSDARTAIRDGRFEDAADSLSAALALKPDDTAEIDALAAELAGARSNQQTEDVLALANERLESGDLLTPKNGSARYYFELVLTNDPDNTAATQGLDIIANRLVLQARGEIDAGRFDAAQELLYAARAIDSTNPEMIATADALQFAREAARRAAAEKMAARKAAAKAAAEEAAAEKAAAEKIAAETAAAAKAAAAKAAADEAAAAPESQQDDIAAAATEAPIQPAETTAIPAEKADTTLPNPAAVQASADAAPANISSLVRTRYVAPKYPRSAVRRNLSGWVDLAFTVATDGTVRDISIRESEPRDLFDSAAIRAVEQWEFEPVIENGNAIEKRAAVRMMFSLD